MPAPDGVEGVSGAPTSTALAAEHGALELWDRRAPFPAFDEIPDLDAVTHVTVEKIAGGEGGYKYLHDSRMAWHNGALYLCWANHTEGEVHFKGAVIRGCRSLDGGMTWSKPEVWAQAPMQGAECFNHCVLKSHQGKLWGFFTCWKESKGRCEVFTMEEPSADGRIRWEARGVSIPGMVPFHPPMKMKDGNWIIGGEDYWYKAAVAVSRGDDFTRWEMVHIAPAPEMKLEFLETALIDQGDRVLAVCRPKGMPTAPVSESRDCGRTWTELAVSNFPMTNSQPCAGLLSTGQHFLLSNSLEEGRALLTIAVTRPGERLFSRVWKVRHQQFPRRRVFTGVFWHGKFQKSMLGATTEWSYPSAVEHGGNLHVSYTQGKECCVVSTIPLRVLAAD